ncbi:short-subunit dehydrogenase [Herbihabitans rhizosphaerae]|uniref:Short-subunit dehydrogenase n=1 Tax=Herbihabitans rhizosphaerae TaxID=1872711 RepID=A0A4Q7KYW3_9PSEU|nr:SDR family NAD(P)-dependent oxidoreductase [Herbihabitans rhizosphaerae]RZS40872.1 short-subunit dehydrogenase [Herbihabitans rhizosphaerae]
MTVKDVLANPVVSRAARTRLMSWLVNLHGSVTDGELRAAVDGKVVLVTGASYGLGEATARRLAAAGATVLMIARTREALEKTAAEIAEAGGAAQVYPADLSDPEQVDVVANRILAEHGPPDVVVHNAGKSIRRSIEDSTDRLHDFTRTTNVNYLGPVKLTLALLPSMRARGRGHFVNVSTIGVRIPPGPRWSAYQASKAAFDIFFRSMAVEAVADGITTSTIYMALVHSRMSAPTGIFDNVPGKTPDQAAELVCAAIAHRPRKMSPWWAEVAHTVFGPGERAWERTSALLYRRGQRGTR